MVILCCAYPGCDFKTEDSSEAITSIILQSHVFGHATAVARSPVAGASSSGPKLERPCIDAGVSLEEWNIFVRRWNVFRIGSGIDDSSAAPQLFQCATSTLGDALLKNDAKPTNFTH